MPAISSEFQDSEVSPTGYAHPAYAESLAEFGKPLWLAHSGGSVLERPIGKSNERDAIGPYPLFACPNWERLAQDLQDINQELISLTLVADPFGSFKPEQLEECFPDLFTPLKEHFIVDLDRTIDSIVDAHHLRNAKKALKEIKVDLCPEPKLFLDEWNSHYATLIKRHDIRGISAFSPQSFARQFDVPGLFMFRATYDGRGIGTLVWYQQEDTAYYHLGAYSDEGYERRASFALFLSSIEYFRDAGLHHMNLGGGAGITANSDDGLSRFKRGWATSTRTAYLCGKIFNQSKYAELLTSRGGPATTYFPAYRAGEFR